MRPHLTSTFLLAPLIVACGQSSKPAAPPSALAAGLALELTFDGSCTPVATSQLACQPVPKEITLVPGVEGQAAHFDGSGAAIQLRGIAALGISAAMTLECFVNAQDWTTPGKNTGSLQSLISHSTIFSLALDPHGKCLQANLTPSGREHPIRLKGGELEPKTWYHVALSFDGQFARLYLNGIEVAIEAVPGELALNDALDLTLGTWFKTNQAFHGQLDSVRLWSRALPAREIAARAALLPPPAKP